MADPQTCFSSGRNLLPNVKNELAKGDPEVHTNGSGTPTPTLTPALSWAPISALAPDPPRDTYINIDLHRAQKLAQKLFV